jgi:hypothetical protein
MHVLQIVLLGLPELTTAAAAAELGRALPAEDWYDWYDVGGRWDGHLGQYAPDLADPNVMALHHPAALSVLGDQARTQDQALAEAQAQVRGAHVGVSDVDGHVFGLPVAASPAAAATATAHNQALAQTWQAMLSAPGVDAAQTAGRHLPGFLTTHVVRRLVDLIDGVWTPQSGFYFPAEQTTSIPAALDLRQEALRRGPDRPLTLALVAVDLHY